MTPNIISYPARPMNGGRLDLAPSKRGYWAYEPKYNGWRVLVHRPTLTCFNRKGELLSIADEFKPALELLQRTMNADEFEWVDCEGLERRHCMARGTLIVLDVIPHVNSWPYVSRQSWLDIPSLPLLNLRDTPQPDTIYRAPAFFGEGGAEDAWEEVQEANKRLGVPFYEGLVAKRLDSVYPAQLDSPSKETVSWVKHRFDQ